MKKILALLFIGISFIALADKINKSSNTPSVKTETAQTDTAYRFGFVGNDTSNTKSNLDFEARIYDSRLGRYYHTDPQQQSPYDSLQRK